MALHTHTDNLFIHNYKTKIPQDTCRIKPWNDPWYYVFLLSPGSSGRNTKQELAPPSRLPRWANPAWTVEPHQPILSSYFPVCQVPGKHAWPLLTVIPQSIPHHTVSKYSVCPCFKTFKLDYIFAGANAYSLVPAAPSAPWLITAASSTSARPALKESSFLITNPLSVSDVSCLEATFLHGWPCTHKAMRDVSRLVQAMPTSLSDGTGLNLLVHVSL